MIKNNCYFQILDKDLEDSLEIIENLITTYYEERDYLYYINSLIFYEKLPSYNEFRKQFKVNSSSVKTTSKLSKEEKEQIKKENNETLKLFLDQKSYKEVSI